jgi:hypothetical protein
MYRVCFQAISFREESVLSDSRNLDSLLYSTDENFEIGLKFWTSYL